MGKQIKEKDRIKQYDWAIFAQSYFLISKLACQELLSARVDKHSKSSKLAISYQPADLYVSILFKKMIRLTKWIAALTAVMVVGLLIQIYLVIK